LFFALAACAYLPSKHPQNVKIGILPRRARRALPRYRHRDHMLDRWPGHSTIRIRYIMEYLIHMRFQRVET
jgi:hypothetical protein